MMNNKIPSQLTRSLLRWGLHIATNHHKKTGGMLGRCCVEADPTPRGPCHANMHTWANNTRCACTILFSFSAINCTQPPFPVKNNDLGMYNWTAVDGVDPRPYASAIKYYCPRENWAYPSTGLNEVMVYCLRDGTWSNQFNIETCQSKGSSIRDIYFKPCPKRYSKPYTNMNTLQKSAKPNTN